MRIALLTVRHPPTRLSPIIPEMARLLREWHVEVDIVQPDERPVSLDGLRVSHDLYVLKSGTELALSVAGALDAQGARLLNPYAAALACRDKVVATTVLRAAGLPVPETSALTRLSDAGPLLEAGPLICKPARGSQGRGVRVVRTAAELDALAAEVAVPGEPWLAQRHHAPDGPDRKLYRIGDAVFGVERQWPARTYEEKVGRPFTPDATLTDMVLRCGATLGALLLGVDVIESDGVPWVVDASSFPGFKGVPDAALRLADFVYWTARSQSPPLTPAVGL